VSDPFDLMREAADLGSDITYPSERPEYRTFRSGIVTAISVGPPAMLTIQGGANPMRFASTPAGFQVGDRVIWVDQGTDPFVIGKLDSGLISAEAEYNAAGAQNINNITDTLVALGTTNRSTGLVTRATDGVGHKFTLNATGRWGVTFTHRWAAAAGGERTANISLNGATAFIATQCSSGVATVPTTHNVSIMRGFTAGDVIRCGCYQSSGGVLGTDFNNALGWMRLNIVYLSGPS
jgi:hypothetical protein